MGRFGVFLFFFLTRQLVRKKDVFDFRPYGDV